MNYLEVIWFIFALVLQGFLQVIKFPCKYKGFNGIVNRKLKNSLLFYRDLAKGAIYIGVTSNVSHYRVIRYKETQ